jgi:hypothetical protein
MTLPAPQTIFYCPSCGCTAVKPRHYNTCKALSFPAEYTLVKHRSKPELKAA